MVASLDELLRTPPDFAVVAVPTEEHVAAARALAAAGVHVLVEKPLAASAEEARAIIDACAAAGVHGAVGHVERFNPALLELRRRVQDGQVGQVFLIATERIGPFPDRIRDVGVVKDLATHDLDLVRWLGGAPVERVAAETQHRMGREHEDLVLATGRLSSGATFNCIVDWLSPTKVRRTQVLGERGHARGRHAHRRPDLLRQRPDHVVVVGLAGAARRLRGRHDALRAVAPRAAALELEAFCDLLEGTPGDPVVTLEEGLATVVLAEAVLASAASARRSCSRPSREGRRRRAGQGRAAAGGAADAWPATT